MSTFHFFLSRHCPQLSVTTRHSLGPCGFCSRKSITKYRKSPFAALGFWSFNFITTFSFLLLAVCDFLCLCFVCSFFSSSFSSSSPPFVVDPVPSGEAWRSRVPWHSHDLFELSINPFGKNWGYKIMARRLYGETGASGIDCQYSRPSLGKTRESSEDRFLTMFGNRC